MLNSQRLRLARIAAIVALAAALSVSRASAQWTHWRGPMQTGVSPETGLPSSWEMDGENHLWTGDVVARSTPVVLNGRVYAIGRVGKDITEQERVVCFDVKTGRLLWEDRFNVFLTTIPFNRVGWAHLAADPETGYVYAHGVGGVFRCYDADGKVVWDYSLTEQFGRISGYGGRTNTPIVDGDLVILSYLNSSWGGHIPRHRFWAFDKRAGDVVWIQTLPGAPKDTTYNTPVVADINGQRLLITGGADGSIYALQARTGKQVWTFGLSKRGINASVVVDGTRVYAAHSEENLDSNAMGRVVCIDATGTGDITDSGEVWRIDGMGVGYTGLAIHKGRLYAVDNASNLYAIDADTGDVHWTYSLGTVGKGSPVVADGKIYAPEMNGRFHIIQLDDDEPVSLDEDEIKIGDRHAEIYGSPAVGYGRIFVPTEAGLYCIGDANAEVLTVNVGGRGTRADIKATQLQAIPSDFTILPGESVDIGFRSFDADGYHTGGVDLSDIHSRSIAANSLSGEWAGLDAENNGATLRFTASDRGAPNIHLSGANAGIVTVKTGELETTIRGRVVPSLPYQEDFTTVADGQAPGFWIGSAGKFKAVDLDGERVLHKPPVGRGLDRSYVYIGSPSESGYTIRADAMGTRPRRSMPDMGLIAQRYVLAMEGNHQRLHVFSWASDLRMAKQVPFEWKPDVWHTMKMRVDAMGDTAVVKGKVWPRGEPEPDAWMIEAKDPLPNREGAPGIYGVSYADLYFDNISITKSE